MDLLNYDVASYLFYEMASRHQKETQHCGQRMTSSAVPLTWGFASSPWGGCSVYINRVMGLCPCCIYAFVVRSTGSGLVGRALGPMSWGQQAYRIRLRIGTFRRSPSVFGRRP